jgi:hypothetical protein
MIKGQAQVISVVLIILIVVVASVIVANFVIPLVREGAGETNIDIFKTQLEIKEVKAFLGGNFSVSVKRSSGKSNISSLKFIFYDEIGETHIIERESNIPGQLETKTFNFTSGEINSNKNITRVSVVPIFNGKAGMEVSKTNIQEVS